MININFQKRIFTSVILLFLLILMYYYTYILIISLIIVSLICWIEFYGLIVKIFKRSNARDRLLKFFFKSLSLLYLFFFSLLIISVATKNSNLAIFIIYPVFISISSDIGGIIFGKTFKGRKLTKISPNKTITGSIGSFIFSLLLIPIFFNYFENLENLYLIFLTLLISLTSQLGDLFISFLKRKAKVKDTGDILPGHGGFLDRIDGILFAIPVGYFLLFWAN